MYIDIGTVASDTATLNFNFGNAASTSRIWDIKVAQIPCGTNYAYKPKYKIPILDVDNDSFTVLQMVACNGHLD